MPADARVKALAYERRIFAQGEIATREGNLHDLFNGLVWLTFPELKAAINEVHCTGAPAPGGGRGPRRDAATLLDESGVVVIARDVEPIVALARRDWRAFFLEHWPRCARALRLLVVGHAVLEKYAEGRQSIVAKALCLVCPGELPASLAIARIDRAAAAALEQVASPAELPPLPLFGVPGWDARTGDAGFYDDIALFRPGGGAAPAAFLAVEGAPRVRFRRESTG